MGRDVPLPHPYNGILPPGSGARGAPDPREGQTTHRTDSHAAPSAHSSESSITPGCNYPDVKVALRCGYVSSPRRKSSLLALRSTSACMTGRNLPLNVIDEDCLDLANSDIPSDQRDAKGFSPATDPPAAEEPVGDGFSPQGSTAATPFALRRDTHVPEGTWSGGTEKRDPSRPADSVDNTVFCGPT